MTTSFLGTTQSALNNTCGAWYAWVLAIESIRFNKRTANSNYRIKLPNISQFDSTLFYKQALDKLKKIVCKVNELMRVCDQLELKLTTTYDHAEKLISATTKALVE